MPRWNMTDQKPKLDQIIANMIANAKPREPMTLEEKERQARDAAEVETVELKQEYEQAKETYEEALAQAYERYLEELLEENENDL